MTKFDSCIFSEYDGDYSIRLCNHPENKDNRIDCVCRGCKLYTTERVLRRCPFCGGKAAFAYGFGNHFVQCSKCGCRTVRFKTPTNAIQTWNRRKSNG